MNDYDISFGKYYCPDCCAFSKRTHHVESSYTKTLPRGFHGTHDVDDFAERRRHCDWIGEFATLTDPSRDTNSLVECPDCGSVDLEIGGGQ